MSMEAPADMESVKMYWIKFGDSTQVPIHANAPPSGYSGPVPLKHVADLIHAFQCLPSSPVANIFAGNLILSLPTPQPSSSSLEDGLEELTLKCFSQKTLLSNVSSTEFLLAIRPGFEGPCICHTMNPHETPETEYLDVELKEIISNGRSRVFQALYNGNDILAKTADAYKERDLVYEMEHEVSICDTLFDLQGIYIPKIVCWGYLKGLPLLILGREYCGNRPNTEETTALTGGQKEHLKKALQAIHDRGVLYTRFSSRHILLDGSGKPWLINFGSSKRRRKESKEEWNSLCDDEMKQLMKMCDHLNYF